MAVTTTPIGVGTTAGDATGDPARTGGQTINTNVANLDAAVEELQSGKWEIDNTSETLAAGEKVIATSHAGITKTLPAATALSSTAYNDIWIINTDTNSTVTIAADGTDSIVVNAGTISSPASTPLPPGWMAICLYHSSGTVQIFQVPISTLELSDLSDLGTTTATAGNVLMADGTNWDSVTPEAADLVERDVPAFEGMPYMYHESRAARSAGTETIDCETEPSVYVPIGGNSVTINLDTPSLSLPVRGLNDVKLSGKVFVKMNGNYSGLTVTTDAGTKLGTFPKGTAPSSSGEWAVLVWEWFDDGSVDFMWAEWVNDS